MAEAARSPAEIISLPQGGGAMHGLGETFTADVQSGTGHLTLPLTVPKGRGGFGPELTLAYSTGSGNGRFGLGWQIALPGVSRLTARGVPLYQDGRDVFVLSGAEELVPVGTLDGAAAYRPRTETAFARILHRTGPGGDHWEITTTAGLTSRYGTPRPAGAAPDWSDPATVADPDDRRRIFGWLLTETRDLLGNRIVYRYDTDEGAEPGHRWSVPLLREIAYADWTDAAGAERFAATIAFEDEARDDAFSAYSAGFEVRTTRRCRAITTAVWTPDERPVRRYELAYAPDPYNGMSLLTAVSVVGYDDAGAARRDLPATTFAYGRLDPPARRFEPVHGRAAPHMALSNPACELVDLTGDGLPDVLELNGVARYWRNLGGARFAMPRRLAGAPTGLSLSDPGVQLLDADGDGRCELVVSGGRTAGYFRLRFGPAWGRFHRYERAPVFAFKDARMRLVDLDGDGVTDIVQAGDRPQCYFAVPGDGWRGPQPLRALADGLPALDEHDPRLRWADMTGDGLTDIVLVHARGVEYWPSLGHGRFGRKVRMRAGPDLPNRYLPERLLLADVDGDGLADLVYVDDHRVTVWFNRCGDAWSEPVQVAGVPGAGWDVRAADLLGTGTPGILWSRDAPAEGRPPMYFLDLTGGIKPRLLVEVDNQLGSLTRVGYASSTSFRLADEADPRTRWRAPLPFPVPVVARVEAHDLVARSKHTATYRYRHGCWDGFDREFRGFAYVEQTDAEMFADYDPAPFPPLDESSYSPPTVTRTWFHVGPLESDEREDDWQALDLADEYWAGDPSRLDDAVPPFLAAQADRRARRDALRSLHGRVLRTELYGRDASGREALPYTVTEHAYAIREEPSADPGGRRVFFACQVASRATQWERGDDPMTAFTFTGDYDPWGQPGWTTTVALPRRSARRARFTTVSGTVEPDLRTMIASHTRTRFAASGPGAFMHDRVAETRTYELVAPPAVAEADPSDLAGVLAEHAAAAAAVRDMFAGLAVADVRLAGHTINHYDGPAFTGLPAGELGAHGLVTRAETLFFTAYELTRAYGAQRPAYLGGPAALPAGAPVGFGADHGYRHEAAGPVYADGWYGDTLRQAHDVQLSTAATPLPARGLLLATQDVRDDPGLAAGRETRITRIVPDAYWLLPASVRDPIGLERTAEYNYAAGQVRRVIDVNGTATNYRYDALGLLRASFVEGAAGEGGTELRPDVTYERDFGAFARDGTPIYVRVLKRVWFAADNASDDAIESREYSDGFGRTWQTRVQADEVTFGADGDDVGLLVAGEARPGAAGGPAEGRRAASRVVVSGWERKDNKGRTIEKYEPFFDAGWAATQPALHGQPIRLWYDPRGRLVRVVNPNGSERRIVFGIPDDLMVPDAAAPTPWATTVYDENDLAPLARGPDGASLADGAPEGHHFTPETRIVDAQGHALCVLSRGGADPATRWLATRTDYDARGNPVRATDQLGRTALAHVYDLANRPVLVDSIDGGRHTTVYDALSNVVQTGDPRGLVTLRTYDGANRLSRLLARDAPGDGLTVRERLVYGDEGEPAQPAAARAAARTAHRLGRLTSHYDEAGVVDTEYDFAGRATATTRRAVSDAALAAAAGGRWTADWGRPGADGDLDATSYRAESRFDALGRPVDLRVPGGRRLTMTYGRSGALRTLDVDGTPYVVAVARNARGQRLLLALGNGLLVRYAYDPRTFQLLRLRSERGVATGDTWSATGATPVQDLTYCYDLAGHVTRAEDRAAGCGVTGAPDGRDRLVRRFAHDPLYRLRAATGRACADLPAPRPLDDLPLCGSYPKAPNQANAPDVTTTYLETYRYDPAGNLVDLAFRTTSGPQQRWRRRFGIGGQAFGDSAQAPDNRLTSVGNAAAQVTLGYDAAGNLRTRDASREYTWDHAGRLVGFRISGGGAASVEAQYLYGADGTRVKKWVRRGGTAALDESVTYVGALTEHHRWARRGGGECRLLHIADGPQRVAVIRAGDVHPNDASPPIRYELADHLGSAAVSLDASGAWINREEYFPYGETSFGSFARKRYRFIGRERDEESSLGYHGARYYAAHLGRWTACDPAGPVDGLNLYAYARGQPLDLSDRNGRATTFNVFDNVRFDVQLKGLIEAFNPQRDHVLSQGKQRLLNPDADPSSQLTVIAETGKAAGGQPAKPHTSVTFLDAQADTKEIRRLRLLTPEDWAKSSFKAEIITPSLKSRYRAGYPIDATNKALLDEVGSLFEIDQPGRKPAKEVNYDWKTKTKLDPTLSAVKPFQRKGRGGGGGGGANKGHVTVELSMGMVGLAMTAMAAVRTYGAIQSAYEASESEGRKEVARQATSWAFSIGFGEAATFAATGAEFGLLAGPGGAAAGFFLGLAIGFVAGNVGYQLADQGLGVAETLANDDWSWMRPFMPGPEWLAPVP